MIRKEDIMANEVKLNGFIQVALVVSDIEKSLDTWCALFNVERPSVRITKASDNPQELYRGKVACYGLKFAVIDCKERGFAIELHEPDDSPSTFREFLDKHGNGVHHLGFEVGEARDAVVENLQSMGIVNRNVGMYDDGSWTIMHTEDTLGVNLNIKPHA